MQMYRHPEHPDVSKNRNEFRGIEQLVGDIREDLKASETELPDTAIHLNNRSLAIAKTNAAQPHELAWIGSNDPCQVVVDTCGPLVCLLAAEHVGSERDAVTQDRDINLHIFHVAQLLLHIDDLWRRGHAESRCALDDVCTAIENTLGQRAASLQMLDKIEALKVCVDINAHSAQKELFSRYVRLGRMPLDKNQIAI